MLIVRSYHHYKLISRQTNNGKTVASYSITKAYTHAHANTHALHTCSTVHFCINFVSVNIWDAHSEVRACVCVCVTVIKYSVIRCCFCLIGKIHFIHRSIERWSNFPRNHIPILLTIKLIAFDFDFEYLIFGPIFLLSQSWCSWFETYLEK